QARSISAELFDANTAYRPAIWPLRGSRSLRVHYQTYRAHMAGLVADHAEHAAAVAAELGFLRADLVWAEPVGGVAVGGVEFPIGGQLHEGDLNAADVGLGLGGDRPNRVAGLGDGALAAHV